MGNRLRIGSVARFSPEPVKSTGSVQCLSRLPDSAPYPSLLLRGFPEAPTEELWREFLARVRYPAHYDSPEFFLEPYWRNQRPFAILLLNENRVIAALTGFDQGTEIVSGLASRPQVCFDLTLDESATSQALADAAARHFPNAKLVTLYTWSHNRLPGLVERGYRELTLEGNVVLDLRPGAKFIFDHFPLNRRRDIRKAIRNGIEVSEATTDEDAQEYWAVYSAWRRTDRKHIHHNRDFAMMATVQQMRTNDRRFLARYKGEVIAASGVRFYPGGLVEYANNCSRDEFLHLRPNDLLVWTMIEWACNSNFLALSMGGAHPFLRKWGDTVVPIQRYRLDRTFLHRVELKEQASSILRQMARSLPMPIQSLLNKGFRAFRRPAA
jgi:hypothetical protein